MRDLAVAERPAGKLLQSDTRADRKYQYGFTAYRDRLRSNLLAKQDVLEVDLDHLIAYNEELANRLRETPGEVMPLVRRMHIERMIQFERLAQTALHALDPSS